MPPSHKASNGRTCPLQGSAECTRENCELWDDHNDCCVIRRFERNLSWIGRQLEELTKGR